MLRSLSLISALALSLAACSTGPKPPASCTGEVRQLNPGRWTTDANALAEPPHPGRSFPAPEARNDR